MEIGLIGTGLMGLPMAQRLVEGSWPLVAYNRTASKLNSLQEAGIAVTTSVQQLLAATDCVILMLTDATAIREVLLSADTITHLPGRTIIQMGTIMPEQSQAIAAEVMAAGGEYLEAPVLGSIPEAKSGNLIVMVGSTPEQFASWSELLSTFGPDPVLLGPVGTAAAVKLALNQLIGSLTTAFALSLGLIQHFGVDVDAFMQILRKSALYAPTFDKKLQRMVESNYTNPNFPTKHLAKDINLFLETATAAGLATDSVVGVQRVLTRALELALADADYAALFKAIQSQ